MDQCGRYRDGNSTFAVLEYKVLKIFFSLIKKFHIISEFIELYKGPIQNPWKISMPRFFISLTFLDRCSAVLRASFSNRNRSST